MWFKLKSDLLKMQKNYNKIYNDSLLQIDIRKNIAYVEL